MAKKVFFVLLGITCLFSQIETKASILCKDKFQDCLSAVQACEKKYHCDQKSTPCGCIAGGWKWNFQRGQICGMFPNAGDPNPFFNCEERWKNSSTTKFSLCNDSCEDMAKAGFCSGAC